MCEIAASCPPGYFLEVGVYKGGSAFELAKVARSQERLLFLYDTFSGIPYSDPDKGDGHKVGDFSDTSAEAVINAIPDAIVVPGLFPGTLDIASPAVVAFAHIDADQYQSITESARAIWPLMVNGGVILFDDYKCLDGATRAVHELFGKDIPTTAGGKAYVRKGEHGLAS